MEQVSTLSGAPQHCNWESIPVERIGEGIERQMIIGDQLMICPLRFGPHVDTPAHEHPHEQITIVERGRVRRRSGAHRESGRCAAFPIGVLAWRDYS